MKKLPKLELGAGTQASGDEFIKAEFRPGKNIDVVFDVTKPWPFKDNSIGYIKAGHILEHLPEPWTFVREAWRVLAPSSMENLLIRLPYGPSEAGVGDVSHLRYYTTSSFACFQPGYQLVSHNLQYNDWVTPFKINFLYRRIDGRLRRLFRPILRRIAIYLLPFLWNAYSELIVSLTALKDGAISNEPCTIPVVDVMFKGEYWPKKANRKEGNDFLFFGPNGKRLYPV